MTNLRETHKDRLNSFVHGDSLEIMKTMPDGSIPLTVFSPPYNLRKTTGGRGTKTGKWLGAAVVEDGYDGHSDDMEPTEYIEWQRQILAECLRLTPCDGAIFYNHQFRI